MILTFPCLETIFKQCIHCLYRTNFGHLILCLLPFSYFQLIINFFRWVFFQADDFINLLLSLNVLKCLRCSFSLSVWCIMKVIILHIYENYFYSFTLLVEVWNGSTPLENGLAILKGEYIHMLCIYFYKVCVYMYQRQVQECSYQDLFVVAYYWKKSERPQQHKGWNISINN